MGEPRSSGREPVASGGAAESPRSPLVGRLVAQRYRLITRLGSGGMADVYLARHVMIERLSAIKILHRRLGEDEGARDRFLREARAVNRLNHPNIVEITDYGESDGLVFLVMEYVPGEPLLRHLERAPLGWRRAAAIGLQVASALGRAHEMGVIHRDLKPANILLLPRRDGYDLVKLTDFGVAKMTDVTTITSSTVALGTPGYVAPEYESYGLVDPRCDLYSLGVVLHEATTGRLPSSSRPAAGEAAAPAPPSMRALAPDVPQRFDAAVAALLARDPDDRPRDGFEAHELLRRAIAEVEPTLIALVSHDPGGDSGAPKAGPPPLTGTPESKPRGGPHLTTIAYDRIAPVIRGALLRVERALSTTPHATPAARAAAASARKLAGMALGIAQRVADDHRAIDAAVAHARHVRADLGARIDEVARERSKLLGWATLLAERSDVVRSHRDSGDHPIGQVEAMLWEQATLEEEEESARDQAGELAHRASALQRELLHQNDALEREMMIAAARLEGHVAALRSVALEAWRDLEEAAQRLEVPVRDLLTEGGGGGPGG